MWRQNGTGGRSGPSWLPSFFLPSQSFLPSFSSFLSFNPSLFRFSPITASPTLTMDAGGTGKDSRRSGDHLRPPTESGDVEDDRDQDLSQSGVVSRAQQKRPTPTQMTETEQETWLQDLQKLLEEIEGRVRSQSSRARGAVEGSANRVLDWGTQDYDLSELTDLTSAHFLSRALAVCCTSDKTAEKSMELTSKLINAIMKTLPAFYGHRSSKDIVPPWVFEDQWKAHGEALENLLWLTGCGIVVSAVDS